MLSATAKQIGNVTITVVIEHEESLASFKTGALRC